MSIRALIVGYVHGATLLADKPWWTSLGDRRPAQLRSLADAGQVFWFRELMVLPELQIERGVLGALGGDCHTACSIHAAYAATLAQAPFVTAVIEPVTGGAVQADCVQSDGNEQALLNEVVQQLRGASLAHSLLRNRS
ncbi:hypothetical protein [Streptomyces tubercidicus]